MNTDPAPRPPKGYKLIIDRDSTVTDLIKGDAIFDHGVPDHGWILITENERLYPKSPISVAVLQEVKSTDTPTPPDGYELLPEKYLGSKNYFLPAESKKWDSGKQQWEITTDFCPSTGNLYAVPKEHAVVPATESVLQEAERLVNGDRQQSYGDASESFERIADFWHAYLKTKLKGDAHISAKDVAAMMILLKVSRSVTCNKRDNWVDAAAYAELGSRLDD